MLNVSRRTLYRRLEENNIQTKDFDSLSDATLDDIVTSIKCDHPNDGEMMQGHLRRIGLKIKRQDLRDSIHRVDSENTLQRKSYTIQRRVYSTEQPNSGILMATINSSDGDWLYMLQLMVFRAQ